MSKIKIKGSASGIGIITIEAPDTGIDRTITLPDSTGTLLDSTSSLDASKLTGDLPAIDGSSLTGISTTTDFSSLTDTTVSTSDPAIDSVTTGNEGHLWVNKTSGETYVCTTATTDNNVWTNIGDGTGNVSPNDPPVIPSGGLTEDIPTSLNTSTTTLITFSGATDTEDDAASIDLIYSVPAASIKNSSGTVITDLTVAAPSGGTVGQLNFTVGSISADIDNATFEVRVTDSYGNWVDSSPYTIDLLSWSSYSISYLMVAGGGSTSSALGGGGGAGGLLETTLTTLSSSSQFTMTVGAGSNDSEITATGFTTLNANAGGAGGFWSYNNIPGGVGGDGGSGGGGGAYSGVGGTATPAGQGNDGGNGLVQSNYWGGGGGGAGSAGVNATTSSGGNGGTGLQSSITGTATYYAGGAGGSVNSGLTAGTGGSGIGGNGGGPYDGTSGAVNTGSGGGYNNTTTAYGGSGIIILKIPNANYSGTTSLSGSDIDTTSVSGYTILTFNGTGTYTT